MTSRRSSEQNKEANRDTRSAARRAFASFFLGGWDPSSQYQGGAVSEQESPNVRFESVPPGSKESRRISVESRQNPGLERTAIQLLSKPRSPSQLAQQQRRETAPALSSVGGLQQQVVDQIDKLIPKDSEALRRTALFKEAYKGIQWQRDNYLVGGDYANWRRKERYRLDGPRRTVQSFVHEMQYDETAQGHGQVAKLAASFIPSDTVRDALLPVVVPLISSQLYPISRQGLCHLIDSQHDNLHHFLKSQILQFINSPENRASIKNSTKGLISTSYLD